MPELTPQQNTQLDSNIRAMLEKGAIQDDVIKYSQDFRSKYDVVKKKQEPAVSFPSARELAKQSSPKAGDILPQQERQKQQMAATKVADNAKFIQTELPKKKEADKAARLVAPVSKDTFNPDQFLKEDMEGEGRESIDKVLNFKKNAQSVADANGIEQGDLGESKLTDVQKNAYKLSSYFKMRLEDFSAKENELKAKLQNAQQDKLLNNPERGDMALPRVIDIQGKEKEVTPQNEQDIFNELNALKDKKSKLTRAVDYFAKLYAKKIKPDADNKELAHQYGKLVGDEELMQAERLRKKGIPISDETKLNEEQVGLSIRAADLEEKYADTPLEERPQEYFEGAYQVDAASKNAINKFPELKQKRIASRLVQELGADAEPLLMKASTGDKEALKLIADKTGFTQKDIRFIETGDLPDESFGGNVAKGIYNAASGLVSGTHRLLGTAFGEDKDRIDYINEKISGSGDAIFGNNPYEHTQVSPTEVNQNLDEVANPKAGRYNYNAASIKNFMGTAIGNLAGFVAGTKGLGTLGMGERAALYGNIILGGQEQRYQQANELMGKDASEAGKNLFALLTGAIEGAAFEFLPKEKLGLAKVDKAAQKEIAQLVKAGSIENVDKEVLKSTIQRAVESVGKSAGEAAKVALAMKGSGLANAIVSSLVAEKGKEGAGYNEFAEGLHPNKIAEEFAGLMIPLGLAEIPHTAKNSRQFKEVLFDSGLQPNESKATIGRLVDEGKMSEADGEKRMKVIDVMSNIQKLLPDTNPTTGEKLNHNQQVEYAYNRVKELAVQAKKEGVKGDVALSSFYDRNAKELVDERKSIIDGSHADYLKTVDLYDQIVETGKHKIALASGTKTDAIKVLQEQALTTPTGLKLSDEITTELIARNTPEEIKQEIKEIKLKLENGDKYRSPENLQSTLDLLQAGLEKTKKPEPKVEISVQPPMDIPKNIEIGGMAEIDKANENGIAVEPPTQIPEPIPLIDKEGSTTEAGAGGKETEPPKPPAEEPPVKEGEGKFKDKGILNRLNEAENVPQHAKDGFAEKGFKYEVQTHEEAAQVGKAMVDKYGTGDALDLAEMNKFKGGVNSAIFAETLNRLYEQERDATTPEAKLKAAKDFAEASIRYDEFSRGQGRDISQIGFFYKKSPLGIKISEEARRQEGFKDFAKKKDKSWKEFFDEMVKEPEFEQVFKENVREELKKERAEARAKRIKKVDDIFDKAKDQFKGGAAYSTIIPPKLITAALEGMKQDYHAGEKVAKIIEDAIDYISSEVGGGWDKDKFRKEWTDKLAEKETKSELPEDKKAKMLEKFRNKLKGLSESQKDDVIRKAFKKLVENGALEYEDFKKIIADTLGYGELTAEQSKKITDLVNEINVVEDLGKQVRENDRSEAALKKYKEAQIRAEKAATELGKLVFNKPDITKRLLSIMQLNTLGVPSLVNNPIFNIFNQATVRLPRSIVMSAIDQAAFGIGKMFGKDIKPENNILQAQKGFYSKLLQGSKQSVEQLVNGLTNKDYFQKEVYASQIHPITSMKELWEAAKGERKLTKWQATDKALQATVGIPAEIVARVLNIGDKPQRYAAEGAQAATFAKQLGLLNIDAKLFMEFPKEEAYRKFKSEGMSEEAAMKKAEEIQQRIINEGEESTFQQDNLVNDAITAAFKPFGKAGEVFKTMNMPFVKIPLNAFWSVYNLANPEIALLQSAVYGYKALKNKSSLDLQQSKKWFAHAVTGMAWMGVTGALAQAGIINPANDDNTTKKEREGELSYEQQNSINMGKLSAFLKGENPADVKDGLIVDLKWFGNMGQLMGFQATKLENMTPEQKVNGMSYMEDMMANLKNTALDFMDKGVFSNTGSLLTAINKGGAFMDSYLLNLMNMATNIVQPATYAQISRAQLPYYSKVKADTFLGEIKNSMLTRSSWLRKLTGNEPASKVGLWGDRLDKKDNWGMRLFGISRQNDDNFAQPIFDDYKKTNNTKFFPSAVKPEVKVGDKTIKLKTKEAEELEILVGQQRKQLVAPYINDMATFEGSDKKYSQLSDEEKTEKLQILYDAGFQNGKDLFLIAHPEYQKNEPTEEEKGIKKQQQNENEILRKQSSNKSASW